MVERVYWLGLLTELGAEPASAAGYARARVVLPEQDEYINTVPILFCPARLPWPILTQAALYDAPDPAAPRLITTSLAAPPDFITLSPLAVDESEEAEIPPGGLLCRWVAAHTPRPFGRYRFGHKAFGTWPRATEVEFRCGARVADRIPVACQDWGAIAAPCSAWNVEPASCGAWDASPTWQGRVCS